MTQTQTIDAINQDYQFGFTSEIPSDAFPLSLIHI